MALDHYVPRTHLRHFTKEYLVGTRAGVLTVYSLFSFKSRRASIGLLASEEEFYANHAADKRWQREESKWPKTVEALQEGYTDPTVISDVLRFAAIQIARVPVNMEKMARPIAFQEARKIALPDKPGHIGMVVDMVSTADLLAAVEKSIPPRVSLFRGFTTWTCYHNQTGERFVTSDNPCVLDSGSSMIFYPLASNLALVGRAVEHRLPSPVFVHRTPSPDFVRRINTQIVKATKDFLYVTEASDGLTQFIRKQRKGIDRFSMAGRTFTSKVDPIDDAKFFDLRRRVNESRARDGRPPV